MLYSRSLFEKIRYIYMHKWRRKWQPTLILLPGKSHGQRSLVGCSLWGRWGSDMTERLHFHFSPSFTAEGNGNPLQCSCLENPRDWGAWWAAIYGIAQSRTQLKWLSSSSSSRETSTFTVSLMNYLILLSLFLSGKLRQFRFSVVISAYFVLFF